MEYTEERERIEKFRERVHWLLDHGFTLQRIAKGINAASGYALGAYVMRSAMDQGPNDWINRKVQTLYEQTKLKLETEKKMTRSGRPQVEAIRLAVFNRPGVTARELKKELRGVGEDAIRMAVEYGVIRRNGDDKFYLTEDAATPGYKVPKVHLKSSPLRKKAAAVTAAVEAQAPTIPETMAVVDGIATPPVWQRSVTWDELRSDVASLANKAQRFAEEEIALMQGPEALIEVVRAEYTRRIQALLDVLQKELT